MLVTTFLPSFLRTIHVFLLACLAPDSRRPALRTPSAETLRDDFRSYMPELLPRFVALLNEAERTSDFSLVCAGGEHRGAASAGGSGGGLRPGGASVQDARDKLLFSTAATSSHVSTLACELVLAPSSCCPQRI